LVHTDKRLHFSLLEICENLRNVHSPIISRNCQTMSFSMEISTIKNAEVQPFVYLNYDSLRPILAPHEGD